MIGQTSRPTNKTLVPERNANPGMMRDVKSRFPLCLDFKLVAI